MVVVLGGVLTVALASMLCKRASSKTLPGSSVPNSITNYEENSEQVSKLTISVLPKSETTSRLPDFRRCGLLAGESIS